MEKIYESQGQSLHKPGFDMDDRQWKALGESMKHMTEHDIHTLMRSCVIELIERNRPAELKQYAVAGLGTAECDDTVVLYGVGSLRVLVRAAKDACMEQLKNCEGE